MRYHQPVYRPPSEAQSLIIQATLGCPHNRCRFCFMYKAKKFKIRQLSDIKEDITSARMQYGDSVRTIFLADGNSLIIKTPQLVEILNFCFGMFPNLERVTSYGAAKFIVKMKTVKELVELQKAGLGRIHMGLETGDDEILKRIQKGATPDDMITANNMVKEAGIHISQYVLLGIAGKNDWIRHAKNTARVLSLMNPDFIRLRTLAIRAGAPLYEDTMNKEFLECTPLEVLNETKVLLENLDCESRFFSDHVSNYANINGKLPEDKEGMLANLNSEIKRVAEDPDYMARLVERNSCMNL